MRLLLLLFLFCIILILVEGAKWKKAKHIMKGKDKRSNQIRGLINAAAKKGAKASRQDAQGNRFRKKKEKKEGHININIMEQELAGIPVLGAEIVDEQWLDHEVEERSKDTGKKTGRKRRVRKGRKTSGNFVDNIPRSVRRLAKRMNPARALAKLKRTKLKDADLVANCSSKSYIFVHPLNGKAQPAYLVKCYGMKYGEYIRAPHAILNLKLKVLEEWDEVMGDVLQTTLTGPGGNVINGPYTYGTGSRPKQTITNYENGFCTHRNNDVSVLLDMFDSSQDTHNEDGSAGTLKFGDNGMDYVLESYFDCTATESEWLGVAAEAGPVLYPPAWINTAPSQMNDALFHIQRAIDLYKSWYGGSPFGQVIGWVDLHWGAMTDNAAYVQGVYSGTLFFGRGRRFFYPLVTGLDIVGHELGHKFTAEHGSRMWYNKHVMGALHESFADMAGKATEFFHTGTVADWHVGYEVNKNYNLRCMDTPRSCDGSLDNAGQFNPFLGYPMHKASGIFNKVFYLLSQKWAYKVWDAFDVFYWTNRTGKWWWKWWFYDAAEAVLTTLSELKDCWHNGYCYDWILEQELVDAFVEVGISCSFTGTGAGKIWDCVPA